MTRPFTGDSRASAGARTRTVPGREAQLVLDLAYRPMLGRDDFIVTPANEAAFRWIDAWPDWPGSTLVLTGPKGCGKSHLAGIWRERIGARLLSGRNIPLMMVHPLLESPDALLIEDAEATPEEAFFHLLNGMAERRRALLLTATTPPARWATRLPDLASRLKALPLAEIGAPDDVLLEAVLRKRFADRGVGIGDDIVPYLLRRIERSFAAADRIVTELEQAALARGRAVTLPLVKEALDRWNRDQPDDGCAEVTPVTESI